MRGGISRNLHGKAGRLVRELEGGAEPAKEAGIAPSPEPEGDGEGLTPQPRPETGFVDEASAFEKGSGTAPRPSGGGAIRKGIWKGFGPERFPEGR